MTFRTIAVLFYHQAACDFIPPYSNFDVGQSFRFSPIDSSVVVSLLGGLDTKKVMGPNDISARFLASNP